MADNQQNEGNNSTMTIVAIVAVIAVIAAAFFFFQYRNQVSTTEQAQAELEQLQAEMESKGQAVQEGLDKLSEFAGIALLTAEDIKQVIADQQAEIDAANEAFQEGLSEVQRAEACSELLQVGPRNADTWYTTEYSEHFQQNIVRYYRDIQRDLDAAEAAGDEEAVEALLQAQEIAQPYYDNFNEQCGDIYDTETGTIRVTGQAQ